MTGPDRNTVGLLAPADLAAMSGLAFLRGVLDGSQPAPPFSETCNISSLSVEEGRIVFAGEPSARFYNPMGIVHGGWISLILDTVMGCAVHSVLPAGQAYTTIEMKTVYVRAIRAESGSLTAEGTLVHKGGQIASAEGKLFDRDRRLVAYGSETCLIRDLGGSKR